MTDTTDTTPDTDEIREMDTKEVRKKHPSGIMKLFNQPSMRFVIDAVLDTPPTREFTKTELASHAGISTETLRKLFPTLTELGILTPVKDTSRYRLQQSSPVTQALIRLGGAVNAMALDENQAALDNIEDFPDTRLSYYCDDCGERGTYLRKALPGHILHCPNDCMDWTLPADNPPGETIRFETTLTDDDHLDDLQTKADTHGKESLTPHEQQLIDCAFDTNSPPPLFDTEPESTPD